MSKGFLILWMGLAALYGQTQRPGEVVDPVEAIPSFRPVEVSGGEITFRMYAPNAKTVQLRGEAAPTITEHLSGTCRTTGRYART